MVQLSPSRKQPQIFDPITGQLRPQTGIPEAFTRGNASVGSRPVSPTGPSTTPFNRDLINEIFGQRPELAFLGHLGESGLGRSQQRALRGQASNFLGRFQQAAGQQLARGNLPTLMPGDFFKNLNFQNEFFRLTPEQRGQDRSRFAPRTRFQF